MKGIEHDGIVTKIDKDNYTIKIVSLSACSTCHAKGACPSSDKKEKDIIIAKNKCRELQIGEKVEVYISQKNGQTAFVIAYTIPAILIIASIITLKILNADQLLSVGIIFGILIIYFALLYRIREKINKKIEIKIN